MTEQVEMSQTVKRRIAHRAKCAVKEAVARGSLRVPETCEVCGKNPGRGKDGRRLIQGHHYKGYAKENFLDVQWLCVQCHNKETPRATGLRNGVGKLTDEDVVEVIRLVASGVPKKEVGAKFGISRRYTSSLSRGTCRKTAYQIAIQSSETK